MKQLNPKQQSFCIEFQRSGNATVAYQHSFGVKDRASAQSSASRLLGDEQIQKYLRELSAEVRDSSVADRQELQEFATSVLRGEIKSVVLDRDGNPIELPARLQDRLKAIELLAKLQGLFVSKQEVELTAQPPIIIVDNV